MIEVVNVVGGGDLYMEIDLNSLAEDLSAHMIEKKSHGLYIKIEDNSPLIIIYRTGKYTITGAKNIAQAKSEKDRLTNIFHNLGIEEIEPSFEIYNIVYKCDLGQSYDLEKIQLILGFEQTEYEPEQAPFLIYRPDEYDCVITISSSGKSVINGVKSFDVAEGAFNNLKTLLDDKIS